MRYYLDFVDISERVVEGCHQVRLGPLQVLIAKFLKTRIELGSPPRPELDCVGLK